MPAMHQHADGGSGIPGAALTLVLLLTAAGGYLLTVRRTRRRNPARGWQSWRAASFLGGLTLLGVALLPPLGPVAHTDFRAHMTQHMLVGMYAPLALVLGAPVTLLLRALPAARARHVSAVMHSPAARALAHPASALLLSTGSLALLYFTPLYNTAMNHPVGHWVLHTHFLASGWLFAYVIAGTDPAPARSGVRTRLVYLGIAIAAHALIAQAMYGGIFVDIRAPIGQVQQGAEIMYYGGDIAELLLAGALVATWRPARPRGGGRAHPARPKAAVVATETMHRPGISAGQ
ncbi:cytochrome c oxidase assembly protein [Streptomyces sp. NPDC059944]|uniref:cytochrome c oxidase assembly protein n=1 Tax=unclassified Streptomyces TaxID=2593676 RepID=UPI0036324049